MVVDHRHQPIDTSLTFETTMSHRSPKHQSRTHSAQDAKIRIIGGEWRSRKLNVLTANGLRPTGDRIKETLFNWLMPWTHGSRCLDVFAGTGSLGLEALSRGAGFVQFIELHPPAADQISSNLKTLKCDRANVSAGSALKWLEQTCEQPYDIIFIDPPFSECLWQNTIDRLHKHGYLSADSMIYVETPKNQPIETPSNWRLHRQKAAGQIIASLYQVD